MDLASQTMGATLFPNGIPALHGGYSRPSVRELQEDGTENQENRQENVRPGVVVPTKTMP